MDELRKSMATLLGGGKRKTTRNMTRASLARRRSYRARTKSSVCRGQRRGVCRTKKTCKYVAKGRRYCRRAKNRRTRRGGARRGGARRGGARRGGARR